MDTNQANIGSIETFLLCEGPTGFEKKMNPLKFFDKFSQGPARDQSDTKIAFNIFSALLTMPKNFLFMAMQIFKMPLFILCHLIGCLSRCK